MVLLESIIGWYEHYFVNTLLCTSYHLQTVSNSSFIPPPHHHPPPTSLAPPLHPPSSHPTHPLTTLVLTWKKILAWKSSQLSVVRFAITKQLSVAAEFKMTYSKYTDKRPKYIKSIQKCSIILCILSQAIWMWLFYLIPTVHTIMESVWSYCVITQCTVRGDVP